MSRRQKERREGLAFKEGVGGEIDIRLVQRSHGSCQDPLSTSLSSLCIFSWS